MGSRFGGVAGVVAIAAALMLALWVAMGGRGIDYETGTYAFNEPATDFVDESRVLVQDGAVTDVWVSEADRAAENYGYTPQTPASALLAGDDSAVTTFTDDAVRQCWFVGTENEHCREFSNIRRLGAGAAAALGDWEGLADGEYYLTGVSVTWDIGSSTRATVANGVVTTSEASALTGLDMSSLPAANGDWVRYWVFGSAEPFAICHDDPRSYDEEECWTWTEATDTSGA